MLCRASPSGGPASASGRNLPMFDTSLRLWPSLVPCPAFAGQGSKIAFLPSGSPQSSALWGALRLLGSGFRSFRGKNGSNLPNLGKMPPGRGTKKRFFRREGRSADNGGGGESRTPVRRRSAPASTCVFRIPFSRPCQAADKPAGAPVPCSFSRFVPETRSPSPARSRRPCPSRGRERPDVAAPRPRRPILRWLLCCFPDDLRGQPGSSARNKRDHGSVETGSPPLTGRSLRERPGGVKRFRVRSRAVRRTSAQGASLLLQRAER